MDNFNFNLFKYFYYVVLYNGVTNASKNLNVAQPSLSLSIKNLELQLNKTPEFDSFNKQKTPQGLFYKAFWSLNASKKARTF